MAVFSTRVVAKDPHGVRRVSWNSEICVGTWVPAQRRCAVVVFRVDWLPGKVRPRLMATVAADLIWTRAIVSRGAFSQETFQPQSDAFRPNASRLHACSAESVRVIAGQAAPWPLQ